MRPALTHPWELAPARARALQLELRDRVESEDRLDAVRTVAGVDVAYEQGGDRLFAAAVVLDAESLKPVSEATYEGRARLPYAPGLLSFREIPAVAACLERLAIQPDLVVCDGQGRAHPRRFGLACHLGVLFDVPAIGCGKTWLCGQYEQPAAQRGAFAPLVDGDEVIGEVVRTRDDTRPVYVSIGHRISLATARAWILRLTPRYRLPETTRAADQRVGALRRAALGR
ncbi:MAG: deoxyribonuclease V [Myxococcales bacterium]|nr:deoxyribonuclease V [Myxococcales bacterium]